MDKSIDRKISHMVTTVSENMKGYMSQQYEHAQVVRKLYHNVGTPTIESFKALLRLKYKTTLVKPMDTKISHMVTTVSENMKGYTLRQRERAKAARKLYHNVGTPTIESFKALLRSNIIQNCLVTVEDVTIADKIYGPDISSLKGKSMRRKPKPVKKDTIEIPKELIAKNHDIDLCIDTMFMNECGMLTAIDKTIKFRSLVPMNTKQNKEYY